MSRRNVRVPGAQREDAHVELIARRRSAAGASITSVTSVSRAGTREARGPRDRAPATTMRGVAHGAGAPWIMRSASSRRAGGSRSSAASARPRPQRGQAAACR